MTEPNQQATLHCDHTSTQFHPHPALSSLVTSHSSSGKLIPLSDVLNCTTHAKIDTATAEKSAESRHLNYPPADWKSPMQRAFIGYLLAKPVINMPITPASHESIIFITTKYISKPVKNTTCTNSMIVLIAILPAPLSRRLFLSCGRYRILAVLHAAHSNTSHTKSNDPIVASM